MASFTQQKNGATRALVRRAELDKPVSKTFKLKGDAERWAREFETELDKGGHKSYHEIRSTTVGDLLRRFVTELEEGALGKKRRGSANEIVRLKALLREPFVALPLDADVAGALQQWRDDRLRGSDRRRVAKGEHLRPRAAVKGQTVARYMKLLSAVFKHARLEWRIKFDNPISEVAAPATEGGERDTIWTDDNVALFTKHFDWSIDRAPVLKTDYIPWVLLLAKETGLRVGNVCGILIERIDLTVPSVLFLSGEVKKGPDYECPLNVEAVRLIKALMKHRAGQDRLIAPTKAVVDTLYRRERGKLGKTHPEAMGLNIHDLRHTWVTKYSTKIDRDTLAKVNGRASAASLFRYYNPKAPDLAKLLD